MKDERGFALLAVMLALTLLTVVVLEFAFAMRLEASASHSFKADRLASHLAEAALQQALLEVARAGRQIAALDASGRLVFHRIVADSTLPAPLPSLDRAKVPLGAGAFGYRITDEEGRLDLNLAPPERVRQVLERLGVERQERDIVMDSSRIGRTPTASIARTARRATTTTSASPSPIARGTVGCRTSPSFARSAESAPRSTTGRWTSPGWPG